MVQALYRKLPGTTRDQSLRDTTNKKQGIRFEMREYSI